MTDNLQEFQDKAEEYYESVQGQSYSDEQVDRWLGRWFFPFVKLTGAERVLDLCCGDGCWALGLLRRHPALAIEAVDLSAKAIEHARRKAEKLDLQRAVHFRRHNCEQPLDYPDGQFDLVFARGLFVFNQHDMLRDGTLELLAQWHRKLIPGGRFVALYGSRPDRLGRYTPMDQVHAFNRVPRKTRFVDFRGGKFNHTPASFVAPFYALKDVEVSFYQFTAGRHTLVSTRAMH